MIPQYFGILLFKFNCDLEYSDNHKNNWEHAISTIEVYYDKNINEINHKICIKSLTSHFTTIPNKISHKVM